MHNGQIGGFDQFRRHADTKISDNLYCNRRGATDSEVLFLYALQAGLERDPVRPVVEAHRTLEAMSRAQGTTPYLRSSVAWSDGERLFAMRLSSDHVAPSLYFRWNQSHLGWAVVSEPLEDGQAGWHELPPGHAAVFEGRCVEVREV